MSYFTGFKSKYRENFPYTRIDIDNLSNTTFKFQKIKTSLKRTDRYYFHYFFK